MEKFTNDEHQEHEKNISEIQMATSHPLQDVNLIARNNGNVHQQQQQRQRQQYQAQEEDEELDYQNQQESTSSGVKGNWVKFDDEVNEIKITKVNNNNNSSSSKVISTVTDNNNIHGSGSRSGATNIENSDASNKLSPIQLLPPPPQKQHTHTSTKTHNTNTRSRTPVMENKLLTSTVEQSMDIAPAILTTESTHVNVNASGKVQEQQISQHQQHQHQKAKKPITAAATSTSTSLSGVGAELHGSRQVPQKHLTSSNSASINNNELTSTISSSVSSSSGARKAAMPGAGAVPAIPVESQPTMRTIELSTGHIREGFANGDVIVTLLPANTKWPWITPAVFRPELVPEELMAQSLTLTVEEYVSAMETLVNDYRFTVYNICYKRILVCWIFFAFAVLITLLLSGLQGVALFSLGVGWLFLNAAAIFLCMWVKLRISRGLEKCLARVNRQLIKHKILLILDDRGRISCHKVNLCFLYFDATQCVNFLNEFLEHTEQNGGEAIKAGWEAKLDIDFNDIVIQGSNPMRLSRKQERGMQLFLRYGSRWGMEALRGLVDVTPLEPGRHCGQFQCPCQYIKTHLQCKPRGKFKFCNFVYWVLASERYD